MYHTNLVGTDKKWRFGRLSSCAEDFLKMFVAEGVVWDCSRRFFAGGREISRHLLESMEAAQLMELRYKMERLEESHICSICLENAWNVAFLCGHSACSKCAESLTLCHMCRKPIQSKINLFTWWLSVGRLCCSIKSTCVFCFHYCSSCFVHICTGDISHGLVLIGARLQIRSVIDLCYFSNSIVVICAEWVKYICAASF